MKYNVFCMTLLFWAVPAFAQVFQPVPAPQTVRLGAAPSRPITVTVQASYFNWANSHEPGLQAEQASPIAELDVPVTNRVLIGGWIGSDRQTLSVDHLDSTWGEFHVSYLPISSGGSTLGITAGQLTLDVADALGSTTGSWTEIGFVGSAPLRSGPPARAPILGLNVAEVQHQNEDEGDAVSYGASLALPIARQFSFNMSVWQLAIHNASTVTIAGAGFGWRL